jgi:hypothetical protein
VEDRLERPIERLTQQINILGEKIKGTQSIIPSDSGSTFKREESPVLTPREKSRERQKAIEFGKALGIGSYAPKGKLEDLTPSAIKSTVVATAAQKQSGETSILGMIGKAIGSIFKVLSYVSMYKLLKPYIEKWIGKNVVTDMLFSILDPIVGIIDSLKEQFVSWFKNKFPETYKVISNITDTVSSAFSWIWEKTKGLFNWSKGFFKAEDKEKYLSESWIKIKQDIKKFIEEKFGKESLATVTDVWHSLNSGLNWIKEFFNSSDKEKFLSESWEEVKKNIKDWFKSIGMKFTGEDGKELGFFDALIKFIKEDLYEKHLKVHVDKIFKDIEKTITDLIGEERMNKIKEAYNSVLTVFEDIKKIVKEVSKLMEDPLGYVAEKTGKAIKGAVDSAVSGISSIFSNIEEAKAMQGRGQTSSSALNLSTRATPSNATITPGNIQNIPENLTFLPSQINQPATLPGNNLSITPANTKTANDFLVSKKGDFVNFSNQDNVLGFKDGGSIDRVLGRKDDALIADTRQILIESRKQVSLLQKIVENTYNANLLLQKLNNRPVQQSNRASTGTSNLVKFNRSEFDVDTSPSFNFAGNLATI